MPEQFAISAAPDEIFERYRQVNLIDGVRVPAKAALDVINPATGLVIGQAAASGRAETGAAVASAKAAQKSWAQLPARERGKRVTAAARAVLEKAEVIAQVLARETGKAIHEISTKCT